MMNKTITMMILIEIILLLTSCENDEVVKEFYGTGELKCEYSVIDGIKNGNYKCFYLSNNIKEEGSYLEGNLDNKYKEFYENGNVKLSTEYIEGVENGDYKDYYQNGHIRNEVKIINGTKTGLHKKYDSLINEPIVIAEYINAPKMFDNITTPYYVNRIWNYIEGDTNAIAATSHFYSIRLNKKGTGIEVYMSISHDISRDGHLDAYSIEFADYDKESSDSSSTSEIVLDKFSDKVFFYERIFTDEEVKQGYVKGIIYGLDDNFVEKDGIKENYQLIRRVLFFNWSIKEKKLINF